MGSKTTPLQVKARSPLAWEKFFSSICQVCALRSKDPHTQVGAVIANKYNQIISTGYNGFPRGIEDDLYPWSKEGSSYEIKYTYVVHAELNAITSASISLWGTTLYTSLFPCANCAKIIIQAGIQKVVYFSDKYKGTEDNLAAKRMLNDAKIQLTFGTPAKVFIEAN